MKTKDTAMKRSSASATGACTARRRSRARSLSSKALSIVMSAILVIGLSPMTKVTSTGADVASATGNTISPGKYGNITYSTNDTKDAFQDSYYDKYRVANSALGDAGSFHIVAFDTLSSAVDIYGNVLAKKVDRIVDFGVSDKFKGYVGLSYIQEFNCAFPRLNKSDTGLAVVGSSANVSQMNGSEIYINGVRIENPNLLMQDEDSATAPFIDLTRVKSEIVSLSEKLSAKESSQTKVTQQLINEGKKRIITYNENESGCAYVSLTASELMSSKENIFIDFKELPTHGSKAVVINVDCQGANSVDIPKTYIRVNGNQVGIGETDDVYGDTGYVLYNFYNTKQNLPITAHECTASIIAPNASITLGPGSACGTFIGNKVTVAAESHVRPFYGKIDTDEEDTTSVSVEKKWLNSKGEAEVDVAHGSITAELWYADASGNATAAVLDASGNPVTVQLSADNAWKHTWSDLPTKSGGQALHYTVKESGLADADKALYDSAITSSGNNFTITNQHKAEVSVSATKKWKDNDNIDKLRPTSVTLSIMRQVDGGAWTSTGEALVLNADNGWAATKTGLPATDANGKEYTYSLQEAEVTGYTDNIESSRTLDKFGNVSYTFKVTNTHQASKVRAKVKKEWVDDNNRDGIRAESVQVNLWRSVNGGAKQIVETKTLTADNNWEAAFEDQSVRGDDGTYTYSIDEVSVAGYDTLPVATSTDEYGNYTFALTNKHEAAKTSVGVHKVWDDSNDADGIRPASVTAQLYVVDAQGAATPVDGKTAVLSADNNWTAAWADLPAKEAGAAIKYTVREVEVPDGYTVNIAGVANEDGTFAFTMTNRHEQEEAELTLAGYSVRSISDAAPEAGKVCYVDPKVNKVLIGRALADGEFAFQLIDDATGAVVSATTNDAAGMVDFDKANNVSGDDMNPCCLQFTAAGTYTYTVREDPSMEKDPTIDYSTEVVTFVTTIDEVDNGDGTTSLVEKESKYVCYDSAADRAAGVAGTVIMVKDAKTGETNSTVHPTITNSVKAIQLGLTKFGADSSVKLPGAVYGLYRAASVAGEDSADDVLVAKATSDADGHMTFITTDSTEVISTDTDYWFKEISAPEGYRLSQEPTQKFQIKLVGEGEDAKYQLAYADGTTSKEYGIGTVIEFGDGAGVTDEALSVKVNKVDSARQGLAGAKLGVRLADADEALDEWTSNGAGHVLTGLVAGKQYVLYEIEVPDGYAKAADVTFMVDQSGVISLVENAFAKVNDKEVLNAYATDSEVSLVDYKKSETVEQKVVQREQAKTTSKTTTKSAVKTGDSLPVAAIGTVAIVCLAIALAAVFASRRRKGK